MTDRNVSTHERTLPYAERMRHGRLSTNFENQDNWYSTMLRIAQFMRTPLPQLFGNNQTKFEDNLPRHFDYRNYPNIYNKYTNWQSLISGGVHDPYNPIAPGPIEYEPQRDILKYIMGKPDVR